MDNLNLSRIKIEGFKSIKKLDLEMKPINVLIGANGSGKTNFISIFELLDIIYRRKLQKYISTRGGADRFLHFGSRNTERITINLDLSDANTYFLRLTKNSDNESFVIDDSVGCKVCNTAHVISRSRSESNICASPIDIIETSKKYLRRCRVYHFHDTSKHARFKNAQDINNNDFLWNDAGNLALFLYRLKRDFKRDYLQIVQAIQAVVPCFHDFVLKPKGNQNDENILLRWQHKNDLDSVFSANQLSDGTARFICMATLFLQPRELRPHTIVLDEPELGLHPDALSVLSDIIQSVANDGSQVIISTQSVTLANCFEPDDFIIVDYENGESKFERFGKDKQKELKEWLENYQMGTTWEENLIGGMPK